MDELINRKSPFKEGGMFDQAHPLLFERAKALRKNMTETEKILWNYLKAGVAGLKFRRQHPLGLYIADFYCHPIRLVIELDGRIHDREDVKENDEQREKELISWGNRILRFKNEEVLNNVEAVLLMIIQKAEELKKAKPSKSP